VVAILVSVLVNAGTAAAETSAYVYDMQQPVSAVARDVGSTDAFVGG